MSKPFRPSDIAAVAERLEDYHAVFSTIWKMGQPLLDTTIQTACVSFDEEGDLLNLHLNPKFWQSQTQKQNDFTIAHESLHVILSHGVRIKNTTNPEAANIAADIVVNETLVREFGFDRKEIDPKNRFCWGDKFFPKNWPAYQGETFEFYYNHLEKMNVGGIGFMLIEGKDGHKGLVGAGDMKRMLDRVAKKLSDEERKELLDKLGAKEGRQAGNAAGGLVERMTKAFVRPKPKWESIVKTRLQRMLSDGTQEVWFTDMNRRLAASGLVDVALPVEIEEEAKSKVRARVYLFLDTSGSCHHLAQRFWNLAEGIPKKHFEVVPHCFDTKVYDIDLKVRQLYGFGGTAFSIIEQRIQRDVKNGARYPEAVFVITDGYGNSVRPEFPNRWHVLLTPQHDKRCFPSTVHFYDLKEFE